MNSNIYDHMQSAVYAIPRSPHPTSKVAATLAGTSFTITRTNFWPEPIETHIGREHKIGNSSGTIHAETACLFEAAQNTHSTAGASLFITDPPCPNCMKNIAEAGITKLYIDHKGFQKDFARRRGDSFENMSMRVAAKAGIDVYVIYRKDQKFEIISRHPPGYQATNEHPAIVQPCEHWQEYLTSTQKTYGDEPFALGLATRDDGTPVSVLVDRHPTIGYTSENVEKKQGKYSFVLQPINRLLMTAARDGLQLDLDHIYSSRVPTSREFVNMIGAGIQTLTIGNKSKSRDEHGITALETVQSKGLLNVQ